jgi:sulfhydrogenase subunit alpha
LTVIRLHRLANEWSDIIGGRTTHPINAVVNGWTSLPTEDQLADLRQRIAAALPDAWALVDVCKTLQVPNFTRDTEYIALQHPAEYAFYEGAIASTDGGTTPVPEYRKKVIEFIVPFSTSKRARSDHRPSFAVGSLARFNNNYDQLTPGAKKAAEALGLKPVNCNPFLNTVAQVVEIVHALEDSLVIIDQLLAGGIHEEDRMVQVKAGTGVGAVEVPRGILFHEYTLDSQGIVTGANLIIPTGQNHQNIEDDMGALIPQIVDRPQEEIRLLLEMLVRAYDPCISCSTHMLRVTQR